MTNQKRPLAMRLGTHLITFVPMREKRIEGVINWINKGFK